MVGFVDTYISYKTFQKSIPVLRFVNCFWWGLITFFLLKCHAFQFFIKVIM